MLHEWIKGAVLTDATITIHEAYNKLHQCDLPLWVNVHLFYNNGVEINRAYDKPYHIRIFTQWAKMRGYTVEDITP